MFTREENILHYKKVIQRKLGASLLAQMVKNLLAIPKTWVRSLGQEDPLAKGMNKENSLDRGAWWATVDRVAILRL